MYLVNASQCPSHPSNPAWQPQIPLCLNNEADSIPKEGAPHYEHEIWSHKPMCKSRKGKTYCTHTTSNFREGNGLSIIANPIAAEAIASSSEATEKATHVSEDDLEVRSLPGKGKGLITARAIAKGQTILLDSPRIIASAQFATDVARVQGQALFQSILDQLPSADRRAVLALDMSHSGSDIENIMKTNSFACQLKDGGVDDAYMCLFPAVSRINHACRPNAHARFIPRTLLMEIKAVRDIAVGEEISISYGRIELKHAERQRLYKEGWNFTCTCSMCSASPYEIAGSDQRRARFAQLRKMLESLTANTYDAQQIVSWEKEIMEISGVEGLETLLAEDYERLAYVYAGHGMKADGRIWANKAKESLAEWKNAEGGPENELVRIEALLHELRD